MNSSPKYQIIIALTFIIVSPIFGDLSDVTFDSSNCLTLSGGGMRKVSIPLPADWKDGLKNQKMADELRKSVKGFYPVENILAYYYNPKKNTEYVEVRKYDDASISYEKYKLICDVYNKALKDGSAKAEHIKMLPGSPDKDIDKRFQLFPSHEKDDHSFHYTALSLDLDKLNIVFSVVSSAFIWIHDQAFIISARTTTVNKSKTMDKMTEARYFISNWVDVILKENGCEANDMSNASDAFDTSDSNNMRNTDDETPAQNMDDENNDSKESIPSNKSDDEILSSKSKIVSVIKNMKAKAKSMIIHDDREDEPSSIHDENDTSIDHHARPSIWRKIIIRGVIIVLLTSIVSYFRNRRM